MRNCPQEENDNLDDEFHNIFTYEFFVRTSFRQLFPRTHNVHVTRKKAAETTLVRKTRAYKVDKIDTLTTNSTNVEDVFAEKCGSLNRNKEPCGTPPKRGTRVIFNSYLILLYTGSQF